MSFSSDGIGTSALTALYGKWIKTSIITIENNILQRMLYEYLHIFNQIPKFEAVLWNGRNVYL